MFRGDGAALVQIMRQATATAGRLGHPRVGSEHLLLALVEDRGSTSDLLAVHSVSARAVRDAAIAAAPLGAGAAADRDTLAPLGPSFGRLLDAFDPAVLDRPPAKEPLFPLGVRRARERCARRVPPIGLDAQAAYEASLRLAVARREREHRPEHLALVLTALDPGVAWVLAAIGADARSSVSDLVRSFPPPRHNRLTRIERRLSQRLRSDDIVRRYRHTSGRAPVATTSIPGMLE